MSYISQITELRDASDYACNRPPEMEDVPLDVAEFIVSTPPTAAELNEMGVRCETCPMKRLYYDSGDAYPYCSDNKGLTIKDVDTDFCHNHPKLRGE